MEFFNITKYIEDTEYIHWTVVMRKTRKKEKSN